MAIFTQVDAGLLHIFICSLLSTLLALCVATESDIYCVKSVKDSLEDPNGYLSSSWNFDNLTEGFMCKFLGVDCWHPDENRVLNLRLGDLGLKGQFPRGVANCTALTGLDLSNNELQGPIPYDIPKLLPGVTSLDLSFNNFSGEIPPTIANCSFLNALKLDHNRLTGHIPQEFCMLDRLKTFSVANNLLSGPVPTFANVSVSADSYANNRGLCGGPLEGCRRHRKKFNWKFDYSFKGGFVIGYVVSAVSVFVVFVSYCVPWVRVGKTNKKITIALMAMLIMRRKNTRIKNHQVSNLQTVETIQETTQQTLVLEKIATKMSFIDLSNATENFSVHSIIGLGKMGTVYKAVLPNGWFLAVKRLNGHQHNEEQLVSELKTLGRLRHDNLLPLLGFCTESNERLLVYKYMSNGNLFNWLHSAEGENKIPEWPIRVKIAVGLARGLAWLHHGSSFRVAHQNISSKCILLDRNFEPKLSNFERAMFINQNGIDVSSSFSEESRYWEWGFVKRDVFNFGIVLLELITGKKLTSSNSYDGSLAKSISEFSASSFCLYNAVDKSLIGKGDDGDIFQLFKVAYNCVQSLPEHRPSMLDVYKTVASIGERYGVKHDLEKSVQTETTAQNSRDEYVELEIEEMR